VVDVRTATVQDRDAVSRTLARAFAADPVIRWLLPAPERDVRLFRVLAGYLHAAPGCSDVAVERGSVVGAALWDPPGHRVSLVGALVGLPRLLAAMGWTAFRRGAVLESAFTEARPREPLWYLAQVGAATPGRGVGSALLEHRLADLEGKAYLESSNEDNVPLYRRFGFEIVQEISLPDDGPTLWTMLRG
jgi:ribosomal protein S18 acetylase RimI-like enzyme